MNLDNKMVVDSVQKPRVSDAVYDYLVNCIWNNYNCGKLFVIDKDKNDQIPILRTCQSDKLFTRSHRMRIIYVEYSVGILQVTHKVVESVN